MGYYKICGLDLIGAVHLTHVATHVGPIIEGGAMPPNKFTLGFFFHCGINLLNQGRGNIRIKCSGIKDYIKARGYNEASKVHSDEEGLPSELGRGKGRREGILHHRCQDF